MSVPEFETVEFISSLEHSPQPAFFRRTRAATPQPLLVHLHSWSLSYLQSSGHADILRASPHLNWNILSPDFRGPNNRPEACASPMARQDILDAVRAARQWAPVDPEKIALIGGSGGGHMSLMMCAHAPEIFKAASIWNPITDLAAWHAFSSTQDNPYAQMLEACCGGAPGDSPEADEQYHQRSPLPFLSAAAGLPIQLNVGIHDGHRGSVPVDHTLRAFNVLAQANGHPEMEIPAEAIRFIREKEAIPQTLDSGVQNFPDRNREVLFYRCAGPVELFIFEGAHDSDFPDGLPWLESSLASSAS